MNYKHIFSKINIKMVISGACKTLTTTMPFLELIYQRKWFLEDMI